MIHTAGNPIVPVESGRYLAEHIRQARFLELPGTFHASWRPADFALVRDAVVDFLAVGEAPTLPQDRVLATVLFTDIVASTALARSVGDSAWHTLLNEHDRIATAEIARHGGRLVKTTGDGVLATFEGPSRGVACARGMASALRRHDVQIRAGAHTGEVELRGDDVAGIGVVIASRICDLAEAEEVLVSRTVKDLVIGSEIELTDSGAHTLKGVPDRWQLYAATTA